MAFCIQAIGPLKTHQTLWFAPSVGRISSALFSTTIICEAKAHSHPSDGSSKNALYILVRAKHWEDLIFSFFSTTITCDQMTYCVQSIGPLKTRQTFWFASSVGRISPALISYYYYLWAHDLLYPIDRSCKTQQTLWFASSIGGILSVLVLSYYHLCSRVS